MIEISLELYVLLFQAEEMKTQPVAILNFTKPGENSFAGLFCLFMVGRDLSITIEMENPSFCFVAVLPF